MTEHTRTDAPDERIPAPEEPEDGADETVEETLPEPPPDPEDDPDDAA
jgi:hypothetical protein